MSLQLFVNWSLLIYVNCIHSSLNRYLVFRYRNGPHVCLSVSARADGSCSPRLPWKERPRSEVLAPSPRAQALQVPRTGTRGDTSGLCRFTELASAAQESLPFPKGFQTQTFLKVRLQKLMIQ